MRKRADEYVGEQYGDDDPVVHLDAYPDLGTAEIIAAKLRSFGIRAQAQPATAHGRSTGEGDLVLVFASDLEIARALIAPE